MQENTFLDKIFLLETYNMVIQLYLLSWIIRSCKLKKDNNVHK